MLRRPMRRWWSQAAGMLVLTLLFAGGHVQAQQLAGASASRISAELEGDATVESRLDADLDNDGDVDTAFVAYGSDQRRVVVMLGSEQDGRVRFRRAGALRLAENPLGRARLSFDVGTLVIEDLAGTDTTTQVEYRYRYDKALGVMRLIELDAARFSRSRRHGSVRLNWDLRSGEQLVAFGTPDDGEGSQDGYRYGGTRRSQRPSPPLAMERTPDPVALLRAVEPSR